MMTLNMTMTSTGKTDDMFLCCGQPVMLVCLNVRSWHTNLCRTFVELNWTFLGRCEHRWKVKRENCFNALSVLLLVPAIAPTSPRVSSVSVRRSRKSPSRDLTTATRWWELLVQDSLYCVFKSLNLMLLFVLQFDETTQDLSVSQLSQSHGADYMEEVAWPSHHAPLCFVHI